jgi:hypothetical protein
MFSLHGRQCTMQCFILMIYIVLQKQNGISVMCKNTYDVTNHGQCIQDMLHVTLDVVKCPQEQGNCIKDMLQVIHDVIIVLHVKCLHSHGKCHT